MFKQCHRQSSESRENRTVRVTAVVYMRVEGQNRVLTMGEEGQVTDCGAETPGETGKYR